MRICLFPLHVASTYEFYIGPNATPRRRSLAPSPVGRCGGAALSRSYFVRCLSFIVRPRPPASSISRNAIAGPLGSPSPRPPNFRSFLSGLRQLNVTRQFHLNYHCRRTYQSRLCLSVECLAAESVSAAECHAHLSVRPHSLASSALRPQLGDSGRARGRAIEARSEE